MSGPRLDLAGKTFDRLTVLKATGEKDPRGNYMWLCECICGNTKEVAGVNLNRQNVRSCGCLHSEITSARCKAGMPKTDLPSYAYAHQLVTKAKGSVTEYECVGCGGQATEWAYDGNDPHEIIATKNHKGLAYSRNPEHYDPRCKRCHEQYDVERRKATAFKAAA